MTSPDVTSVAPVTAATGSRRRQRSTRITVAASLLIIAAVVVGLAAATGWFLATAIAAVVAVVLGAAAARITYAEVALTRRETQRERAELARSYLEVTDAAAAENREFRSFLLGRTEASEALVRDLEAALTAAHQRAADAIRARGEEARRAAEAREDARVLTARLAQIEARAAQAAARVTELEGELSAARAELVTRARRTA